MVTRLQSPLFRKSFATNPLFALERAGIKVTDMPSPVLDYLADLSLAELDVLGRISEQVKRLADDTQGYVVF